MAENCCSGSPCEEVVTLGYMIGMASSCGSITAHSDFSSCCSADGSAYTPTYSDIINERYAKLRSISSNPKNDINGFSAYTQTLDDNECGGVTANDKLLAKSQLAFEYTEVTGVSISSPSKDVDPCGYDYSATITYGYLRHKKECGDVNTRIIDTSTAVSFTSSTTGHVSANVSFNGQDSSGYFESVYNNATINSETITDGCGNTKSASTTVSVSNNTYSCYIEPYVGKIPCSGGTIRFGVDSNISYSFTLSIDGSEESISPSSSGEITIGQNKNSSESNLTLTMNVSLCGEIGSISMGFIQEGCQYGPDAPTSTSPCGVYWPTEKPKWGELPKTETTDKPEDNYGCN